MDERSWLIRTQSKKILGPVNKAKVIELIEQSALGEDDEVAQGNGHWFWLREKNFVDRYLYGNELAPPDPTSDVESVLTASSKPESSGEDAPEGGTAALDDTLAFSLEEAMGKKEPPQGEEPPEEGVESTPTLEKETLKEERHPGIVEQKLPTRPKKRTIPYPLLGVILLAVAIVVIYQVFFAESLLDQIPSIFPE